MDWRPGLSECGATVLAVKSMAKRLLIKALTARGCYKESERGIHEKWRCPCGENSTAVPRHGEITAGVVRKIERHMACLPEGWLQ
jgi:predicted RNA binding protein YcfA (HicA-like mRNA interferase family)